MQLFVLQREIRLKKHFLHIYKHFNWFRLDSDGAHKVHKCKSAHSNISLYCGFKALSVKGLKTANTSKALCSS